MEKIIGVHLTKMSDEGARWETFITYHTKRQGDYFKTFLMKRTTVDGRLIDRRRDFNTNTFNTLKEAEHIGFIMVIKHGELAEKNGYKRELITKKV